MRRKHRWYDHIFNTLLRVIIFLILMSTVVSCIVALTNSIDNRPKAMNFDSTELIPNTDLHRIEDTSLYYDEDTKIIYYMIYIQDSVYGRSFGFMNEYISENGKLCRYVDNKITEIE